jgi:hypothetical protein
LCFRGVNRYPTCESILDNSVLAALPRSGLPEFLPNASKLSKQERSSRSLGLKLHPFGPAIAPPLCVPAHLQAGLASNQRGVPQGCFSHPTCSRTGRRCYLDLIAAASAFLPMTQEENLSFSYMRSYITCMVRFCQAWYKSSPIPKPTKSTGTACYHMGLSSVKRSRLYKCFAAFSMTLLAKVSL